MAICSYTQDHNKKKHLCNSHFVIRFCLLYIGEDILLEVHFLTFIHTLVVYNNWSNWSCTKIDKRRLRPPQARENKRFYACNAMQLDSWFKFNHSPQETACASKSKSPQTNKLSQFLRKPTVQWKKRQSWKIISSLKETHWKTHTRSRVGN